MITAPLSIGFRIDLLDIEPAVWRRFVMLDTHSLADLHRAIGIVMGWEEAHLHEFAIGGTRYSEKSLCEPEEDIGYKDEQRFRLADVVRAVGTEFRYLYDFGDSWQHRVIVESCSPADSKAMYPVCLDGANACPPEDCGGAGEYQAILASLSDSNHPSYGEVSEWLGQFDPTKFDRHEVNKELRRRFRG
ncbi:MAG: TnpR protein [Candidatus Hydrogenedentota bacterium]